MNYVITAGALAVADGLIRQFEGCRLAPYRDPLLRQNTYCIGYGNRALIDGTPVTANTLPISQEYADALLNFTLKERVVPKFCTMFHVSMADNQAGALLSLDWNVGTGAILDSHIPANMNAGHIDLVPAEIRSFDHVHGKLIRGLRLRRVHEAAVFIGTARPQVMPPTTPDLADQLNLNELHRLGAIGATTGEAT